MIQSQTKRAAAATKIYGWAHERIYKFQVIFLYLQLAVEGKKKKKIGRLNVAGSEILHTTYGHYAHSI